MFCVPLCSTQPLGVLSIFVPICCTNPLDMSSVLCSSMLHTYLLVCQILCVPLCCANPLSMSSVLCSFMLYNPLGYLCGMYFVFLYVVHTSWECFLSVSCFSMLYIILWQFGCFAFLSDGSYHLNISSGLFSYI